MEQKLETAFEAIAGSISIAASQGIVTDPMGEKVALAFDGANPVITNNPEDYNAGRADVYISQAALLMTLPPKPSNGGWATSTKAQTR